jgi:SAM-dependent methyltransferase
MAEGTPPERFRVEHAHYVEDIPFWRALAADLGGPVLDLGAAVGRVTLPLARDGHAVWAVDGSAEMLRELTVSLGDEPDEVAARVHVVRADLRDFALGRTFPLAVMPMNTLQALLTRAEQAACLECVRRHLTPDGTFCFDVAMPDLDAIERRLGDVQVGVTWRDEHSGLTLAHSAWFDAVDRRTGTVAFTARIDEAGPDGAPVATYLRPHTVHLFPPSELWELLGDAGLEVHALYGDFDGRPLETDAERQVYRCGVAP